MTSFAVPAVTLELWFVLALLIIGNCRSAKEAVLKTFVFFVISQPLVYLVEVPFKAMGWELFGYYKYWACITVLTIPGAFIAYQVKRKNVLSAVILSVATGYLLYSGLEFAAKLPQTFPGYLLITAFCFFFAFALIFVFLPEKKERTVGIALTVLLAAGVFIYSHCLVQGYISVIEDLDPAHTWTVSDTNGVPFEVEIWDDHTLYVNGPGKGEYTVYVENELGEVLPVRITVKSKSSSLEF